MDEDHTLKILKSNSKHFHEVEKIFGKDLECFESAFNNEKCELQRVNLSETFCKTNGSSNFSK